MAAPLLLYPVHYITITQVFSSSHSALDLGWNSAYGGKNQPIYAPAAGKVIEIDNSFADTPTTYATRGNRIKIDHGDKWYSQCCHLQKDSLKVKVGDQVQQGQQIANMGISGYATGNHVHYEVFYGGSTNAYRVNPISHCYATTDMVISASSRERDNIKIYTPSASTQVGTPVSRDSAQNQIEVASAVRNARSGPSLDATRLGYLTPGIYNFSATVNNEGYDWLQVEGDIWIAQFATDVIYWAETPGDTEKLQQQIIASLTQQAAFLQQQLSQATQKLAEADNVIASVQATVSAYVK